MDDVHTRRSVVDDTVGQESCTVVDQRPVLVMVQRHGSHDLPIQTSTVPTSAVLYYCTYRLIGDWGMELYLLRRWPLVEMGSKHIEALVTESGTECCDQEAVQHELSLDDQYERSTGEEASRCQLMYHSGFLLGENRS